MHFTIQSNWLFRKKILNVYGMLAVLMPNLSFNLIDVCSSSKWAVLFILGTDLTKL